MKAKVQYNDFIGTSAADISDHTSLDDFLNERGVDTNRYNAIGADFYSGYSDYFSGSIICVDKKLSTNEKKYLVSIGFENELSKDEFFDLFKRFNVTILQRFGGYENLEIDKELTFDDRNKE
jgi:hypothetical protein